MRNQKVMFLFLFAFMSFAILGSSMILAEEGDNNLDDSNTETTDNSDSGESSIENVETTSDDESKVETETKVDRERLKEIAKKRLEERREKMRENLKKEHEGGSKKSFDLIVGQSINETFVRSINTSLTTLLAVLALYIFGPETTRHFAIALFVGIVSGVYSSIFIGSPLLVTINRWKSKN